jgi:tetratricopeptide (TPR) repeat protein
MTDIKEENIFMIISGEFARTTIPTIHEMAQINTIYILCEDKVQHEQWAKQWPKVKGVFKDITSICEALKLVVQECDRNIISMSFIPLTDGIMNSNFDQLDSSFMYTQLLKEILLTIDFDQKNIDDFIKYCHKRFNDDIPKLRNVDMLEKEYHEHVPIWWYTSPYFLYQMLNHALRTMDVDLIINMGVFVRDLHEHIAQLYRTQYAEYGHTESFTVYRGQGLLYTDFNQLKKAKGGLMSFNNFLSTSLDREVSLAFAESNQSDPNMIGILFKIKIRPSISSTPFADVSDVCHFQAEKEILFSMHSVFRIEKIKEINGNNRLWQVDLISTNDNDPQLYALTERIREETLPNNKGWFRLSNFLFRVGEFDKAQQVCEFLLAQTPDDHEKAGIYHVLGWIKDEQRKYEEAITFYEKAIHIHEVILSPTDPDLGASYCNAGQVYEKIGKCTEALSYHKKALEISQKTLGSEHSGVASCLSGIALVYERMGKHSEALSYHEKALEIFKKTLSPIDPDLGKSYNNIGRVYNSMGNYSRAISFLEKAIHIKEKALRPNDPSLSCSYGNIGQAYYNMRDYSKALAFYEKELQINQQNLAPNHPDLAKSYDNIGNVYSNIGDYPKARSCYERAVDIGQQSLPSNHTELQK